MRVFYPAAAIFMPYIIKYFPEITIKSKPVRKRLVNKLRENLLCVLKDIEPDIRIKQQWDKLIVHSQSADPGIRTRLIDAMERVAGIAAILEVNDYPLVDLDDAAQKALHHYGEQLAGKTFAARVKRSGQHDFTSVEAERHIGSYIMRNSDASAVKLKDPDVTVAIEISQQQLFIVGQRIPGLGGYPVGGAEPVMSLLSGGFDSPVASYLTMKRGMRTHFIFFNLGGRDHEIGVKEVALYLWQRYGCGQRVLFVSVPFEEVVAELLNKVADSYMGVLLKRMMLRVAERIASDLDIDALVTGEAVAQVSSQTVRNLSIIDQATPMLVMRPLVAADKSDIIQIAHDIGTEPFAANMPEYCGVISVNPTTRAKPERVEHEESRFDMNVLERAITNAKQTRIDRLADEDLSTHEVEVLTVPLAGCTVIDIRHPDEEEQNPLNLHVAVKKIPFYALHSRISELDTGTTYMLYCEKGVMSRLHANHLAQSELDVRVYRPA